MSIYLALTLKYLTLSNLLLFKWLGISSIFFVNEKYSHSIKMGFVALVQLIVFNGIIGLGFKWFPQTQFPWHVPCIIILFFTFETIFILIYKNLLIKFFKKPVWIWSLAPLMVGSGIIFYENHYSLKAILIGSWSTGISLFIIYLIICLNLNLVKKFNWQIPFNRNSFILLSASGIAFVFYFLGLLIP